MFHCLFFFSFVAMSKYLSLILLSPYFTLWSTGTAKSTIQQILFFVLTITMYSCLAGIRWTVYISESLRILCVSFSGTKSGLCIDHLFVRSNFIFLHNFPWITFPTPACQVLYCFLANLLHLVIIWLSVSLYCHITYICNVVAKCLLFSFVQFVFIALFCDLYFNFFSFWIVLTHALGDRFSLEFGWD